MRAFRVLDRELFAALFATLLTIGALRAFISTVYFLNLSTLEINSSVAWTALFLAPAALLVPAVARRGRVVLLAAGALLVAARLAMGLTWGEPAYLMLAGLAVAGGLCLLPALAHQARLSRGAEGVRAVAAGSALGWALDAALTYAFVSVDPTLGPRGLLVVVPAGALLVALTWTRTVAPRAWTAVGEGRGALLAGAALGAWIFLQHAVLASPHHLARWNELPVAPLAVASVLGLALPAVLAWRGEDLDWRWLTLLHVVALAGVLVHTFWQGPALLVLLLPAQGALALDLALLLRRIVAGPLRLAGAAMLVGSIVTLVLQFVFAFALNFAYVPLGAVWKGSELWLVPGAFLLASLPALAAARASDAAPPARLRGRSVPIAIAIPALVVLGGLVAPAAAIEAPAEDEPLRVLAFNVHQGFGNRGVVDADVFVRVLREEAPDVVLLQENDDARITSGNVDVTALLAKRLGYHEAYGPPTSAQSYGVGILSKFPIREWRVVPLPSTEDNRYFVEARLDVHGKDVWAYAVHLGLPADDRMAQTTVLLDMVAQRNGTKIVGGDLNSCPFVTCPDYDGSGDDVYARFAAALVDAGVAAGGDPNAAALWTYPATGATHRLDYVFVSPDVAVAAHRVVRSDAALGASDHLPVLAELRLA